MTEAQERILDVLREHKMTMLYECNCTYALTALILEEVENVFNISTHEGFLQNLKERFEGIDDDSGLLS